MKTPKVLGPNATEMLTMQEVAQELRQSVKSVRRRIAERQLRAIFINARVIRIRRRDLDQFLNARQSL